METALYNLTELEKRANYMIVLKNICDMPSGEL